MSKRTPSKKRWRFYTTPQGASPVKSFLGTLNDDDAAAIAAAMLDVRTNGLQAARHVDGDIWEVRARTNEAFIRVLFAEEGKGRVLLAIEGFKKKSNQLPPATLKLAKNRLTSWRGRKKTT